MKWKCYVSGQLTGLQHRCAIKKAKGQTFCVSDHIESLPAMVEESKGVDQNRRSHICWKLLQNFWSHIWILIVWISESIFGENGFCKTKSADDKYYEKNTQHASFTNALRVTSMRAQICSIVLRMRFIFSRMKTNWTLELLFRVKSFQYLGIWQTCS